MSKQRFFVTYGGNPPHASAEVNRNYDGFGQAYAYFNGTFGWDSFDDASTAIKSYIHWGTTPHAAWDKTNERFHFAGTTYAEADDLIGHEYAHAVLDHSSWNPTMTGETGAIAESVADLYGEFIDRSGGWASDPSGDDWLVGETLSGGAIRDMADPAAYDDPSWRGSTIYYYGGDNATYIHTNNGVGNKVWQLLTDGTGTGTFRDYTVTGLGQTAMEALVWELPNHLTTAANYEDLYDGLVLAAAAVYGPSAPTPHPTGHTYAQVLDAIEQTCVATGVKSHEQSEFGGAKSYGQNVRIKRSAIIATTYDGFPKWKLIPYKLYVPDDGFERSDTLTADWPLDVIILSHGAGQNMEIASGYDDNGDGDYEDAEDVEGLATYWANQGYIVVAPTYTKRKYAFGTWFWEWPNAHSSEVKLITDFIRATFVDVDEFLLTGCAI